MKKLVLALSIATSVVLTSCGYSKEEKACCADSLTCDSTKVDTTVVKTVETSTVTVDSTKK